MAERWRAEKNGVFYSIIFLEISDSFMVVPYTERYDDLCYSLYKKGNYFRTEEEAQAAADNMQKVLLRHAGELHDFTWALDKLRQGYKVRRQAWHPERYLHYFPSRVKGLTYPYDSHSGMCEGFVNGLEFTDWEIYEDKE